MILLSLKLTVGSVFSMKIATKFNRRSHCWRMTSNRELMTSVFINIPSLQDIESVW